MHEAEVESTSLGGYSPGILGLQSGEEVNGAGIKAVYYGGEYKNEIAEEILALAGIPVIRLERKPDTPTNPFDSCVVNRPKQEYFLTCNDRTPADG